MKKNVGRFDSWIRSLLGLGALVAVLLSFLEIIELGTVLTIVLLVLGVIFITTGRLRTCGIYSLLKIDTLEKEK